MHHLGYHVIPNDKNMKWKVRTKVQHEICINLRYLPKNNKKQILYDNLYKNRKKSSQARNGSIKSDGFNPELLALNIRSEVWENEFAVEKCLWKRWQAEWLLLSTRGARTWQMWALLSTCATSLLYCMTVALHCVVMVGDALLTEHFRKMKW